MRRLESGSSIIYLDDRFFPVVISTWVGTANLENCEAFAAWHTEQLERAIAAGLHMVSISDSARAERPPPVVRRFFADWTAKWDEEAGDRVTSIAVITNPLLRGAMTAIGWIRPEVQRVVTVPDVREALARAIEILEEHGQPAPAGLDPDTYVSPAEDARAAGGT